MRPARDAPLGPCCFGLARRSSRRQRQSGRRPQEWSVGAPELSSPGYLGACICCCSSPLLSVSTREEATYAIALSHSRHSTRGAAAEPPPPARAPPCGLRQRRRQRRRGWVVAAGGTLAPPLSRGALRRSAGPAGGRGQRPRTSPGCGGPCWAGEGRAGQGRGDAAAAAAARVSEPVVTRVAAAPRAGGREPLGLRDMLSTPLEQRSGPLTVQGPWGARRRARGRARAPLLGSLRGAPRCAVPALPGKARAPAPAHSLDVGLHGVLLAHALFGGPGLPLLPALGVKHPGLGCRAGRARGHRHERGGHGRESAWEENLGGKPARDSRRRGWRGGARDNGGSGTKRRGPGAEQQRPRAHRCCCPRTWPA
jgi:hypothetical protein